MVYTIQKKDAHLTGEITLDGSKSISNRALLIQALGDQPFDLQRLSTSKDTTTFQRLLTQIGDGATLDAGAAGTTFRFMTALLATRSGTQILTGTQRMKQRPVGILVDALRSLGANIEYLEKEGFPPLQIGTPFDGFGKKNKLTIAANTSSQYISALLMLAPTLPNGLHLTLEGNIVSRPYIQMTLDMMAYFGVESQWKEQSISVARQPYQPRTFVVEADWSAASYYYAMAAFAEDDLNLRLNGLFEESVQGDAVIADMMEAFGVKTVFKGEFIYIKKNGKGHRPVFEWNFLPCPDIAQTMAVVCGGLGVQGLFSGLETLRIKETDRIQALQTELGKMQVFMSKLPDRFVRNKNTDFYMIEGKILLNNPPLFETYEDHRMAMAFAPLAMYAPVRIKEPMVVEKSYPRFWQDLQTLGFEIK